MSMIDTFNSAVSDAVNKGSEDYKAIVGDSEFTPEAVILDSGDFNCGALCNELEYLKSVATYYVQSFDLDTAEGENLDTLVNAFINLPRRNRAELDSVFRNRYRSIVVEKSNQRRTTTHAIRDALSYFIDDLSILQVVEDFDSQSLYFQVRIEGAVDTDSALFVGNFEQGFLDQQFVGGEGVGEVISYVGEIIDRIKAVGVDYDVLFVRQNRIQKTSLLYIGTVQMYKTIIANILTHVIDTKNVNAVILIRVMDTKNVDAEITEAPFVDLSSPVSWDSLETDLSSKTTDSWSLSLSEGDPIDGVTFTSPVSFRDSSIGITRQITDLEFEVEGSEGCYDGTKIIRYQIRMKESGGLIRWAWRGYASASCFDSTWDQGPYNSTELTYVGGTVEAGGTALPIDLTWAYLKATYGSYASDPTDFDLTLTEVSPSGETVLTTVLPLEDINTGDTADIVKLRFTVTNATACSGLIQDISYRIEFLSSGDVVEFIYEGTAFNVVCDGSWQTGPWDTTGCQRGAIIEGWTFSEHTSDVLAIAISPDGSRVYSGASLDSTVKEIVASDGSAGWTFSEHTDSVRAVAVSPDGSKVYSASYDDTVKEIDASDGSAGWTFSGHTYDVLAVAVSPDGSRVYSGSQDDTVKEIDASDGSAGWTFSGHTDAVRAVAVSPDGSRVYSGSSDYTVKEIVASDGSVGWTFSEHTAAVRAVAVSPDGSRVYSGALDYTLKEIIASDGSAGWTFSGHTHAVLAIAVSSDGSRVYSGAYDDTVKEIIASDGSAGWTFSGHTNTVYAVAVSPDGSRVYSGSSDDTVKEIKVLTQNITYR